MNQWLLTLRRAEAARENKTLIGASVERVDAGSKLVADAVASLVGTFKLQAA